MGIVSYLAIHGRLRKLVTGIQPRIFLSNRHSPVGIPRPIRAPVGSSFLWTLSSRTYRKNLFVYLASRMSYPWADKLTRVQRFVRRNFFSSFLSWQGNNSEYESWRVRNAWTRGDSDTGEEMLIHLWKGLILEKNEYRKFRNVGWGLFIEVIRIFKLDEVRRK